MHPVLITLETNSLSRTDQENKLIRLLILLTGKRVFSFCPAKVTVIWLVNSQKSDGVSVCTWVFTYSVPSLFYGDNFKSSESLVTHRETML